MTERQSQTTFQESLTNFRVKNTGSQTVPSYSVVAMGDGAASTIDTTPGAMTRDGDGVGKGRFSIKVRRPDAKAMQWGAPSQFLITQGGPIEAGKFGVATVTLPTWVEVDATVTKRGQSVMPVVGQFKLYRGAGYYNVMDIKTATGGKKYAFVRQDVCCMMVLAKTPSGGIPRSTTAGTFPIAECELFHVTDNGTSGIREALMTGSVATKVRVANMSSTGAVPGGIYIGISRIAGGVFVATWQDCG